MTDEAHPEDLVTEKSPVPVNPVTAARLQVEAQIPPEKRGPGWDRHWRELEHYAEAALEWTAPPPAPPTKSKRRRRR
jgi:hypothetical protein